MFELIKLNLGPFIGFLFTTATLIFIIWGAAKTERAGALEALQAEARGEGGQAEEETASVEGPASGAGTSQSGETVEELRGNETTQAASSEGREDTARASDG
ncbi:MAG: hypothetical protein VKN33_07480 [Candidatus Sericytochromatia bacterium]|nr:hypothetical protein [Candidatus Sericytochromatia bacterium]